MKRTQNHLPKPIRSLAGRETTGKAGAGGPSVGNGAEIIGRRTIYRVESVRERSEFILEEVPRRDG